MTIKKLIQEKGLVQYTNLLITEFLFFFMLNTVKSNVEISVLMEIEFKLLSLYVICSGMIILTIFIVAMEFLKPQKDNHNIDNSIIQMIEKKKKMVIKREDSCLSIILALILIANLFLKQYLKYILLLIFSISVIGTILIFYIFILQLTLLGLKEDKHE